VIPEDGGGLRQESPVKVDYGYPMPPLISWKKKKARGFAAGWRRWGKEFSLGKVGRRSRSFCSEKGSSQDLPLQLIANNKMRAGGKPENLKKKKGSANRGWRAKSNFTSKCGLRGGFRN